MSSYDFTKCMVCGKIQYDESKDDFWNLPDYMKENEFSGSSICLDCLWEKCRRDSFVEKLVKHFGKENVLGFLFGKDTEKRRLQDIEKSFFDEMVEKDLEIVCHICKKDGYAEDENFLSGRFFVKLSENFCDYQEIDICKECFEKYEEIKKKVFDSI